MDAIGLVGLMSSRFQRLLYDHAMIEASITALRPRQCGVSSMSSGRARPSLAGSLPIKGDHCLSKQNVSGCRESTRRTSVAQDRSALKAKRDLREGRNGASPVPLSMWASAGYPSHQYDEILPFRVDRLADAGENATGAAVPPLTKYQSLASADCGWASTSRRCLGSKRSRNIRSGACPARMHNRRLRVFALR